MKASLVRKLEVLHERHQELAALLSDNAVIADSNRFRDCSKEYAQLEPVVSEFNRWKTALDNLAMTEEMLTDSDPSMRDMAREELPDAKQSVADLELSLQKLLLPTDPNDERNVYLEIRAGTGGDEAAIFAGDLFRMYSKYADRHRWQVEIVSESAGEHGGYREVIARIIGLGVYSRLKFESGAHRVQRVPETEAQGRVHTSAATVAILPEVDEVTDIDINPADLKTDTYRSSGAGGQHVNKTDSAIRITHIPTGIVVECQDERSQHKNRAKAMSLLAAKLKAQEVEKQQSAQAEARRLQVGTGDRSERIRTYNFPQGRLTDHRVNLTLYSLANIVEGDLDQVIDPLVTEYQTDQLAALSADN